MSNVLKLLPRQEHKVDIRAHQNLHMNEVIEILVSVSCHERTAGRDVVHKSVR